MKTNFKQREAFVESIIDSALLELAIGWISSELEPDDVFHEAKLERWAFENGFRKFE